MCIRDSINAEYMGSFSVSVREMRKSSVAEISGSVKVFVRVRPKLRGEEDSPELQYEVMNGNTIRVMEEAQVIESRFNGVFESDASQEEVFSPFEEALARVLDGYNCTIFAYGQTGTGKTHTIFGNLKESFSPEAGLIPRSIEHIFQGIDQRGLTDVSVFCSFIQIYNERVYDLLQDGTTATALDVRQDSYNGGVYIADLSEFLVRSPEEMRMLLVRGEQRRAKRQTKSNLFSSRSHSIFRVSVERRDATTGSTFRALLNVCDLAGSEKWNKDETMQVKHINEMTTINLSLSTLGKVISALARKDAHVPYRDSKLTRILQSSLGGNNNTLLIATVSPLKVSFDETVNTLKFADRAKHVMTKVKLNVSSTHENALVQKLQREITTLQDIIGKMTRGNKHLRELQVQVLALREENHRLKEGRTNSTDLERLLKENTRLKELISQNPTVPEPTHQRKNSGARVEVISARTPHGISTVEMNERLETIESPRTQREDEDSYEEEEEIVERTPPMPFEVVQAREEPAKESSAAAEEPLFQQGFSSFGETQFRVELGEQAQNAAKQKQKEALSDLDKLKQRLLKDGRCAICTLPVPCRHTPQRETDNVSTTHSDERLSTPAPVPVPVPAPAVCTIFQARASPTTPQMVGSSSSPFRSAASFSSLRIK
eukprot:TRINITY_DN7146_c0_g1_i1.p1 TRINITY_DN7146_c0_g1~~TRINITY_DN7146_c0_g1_i1.p1  ORF type:complete len:660 (+),score=144.23 TRINITY_DN7146_c0_g1_i1:66-2045(+)